jgi:hypothetical protein
MAVIAGRGRDHDGTLPGEGMPSADRPCRDHADRDGDAAARLAMFTGQPLDASPADGYDDDRRQR